MANTVTLTLRDGREIVLREPTGADLRGIMLANLVQGSIAAHTKLRARISTPPLAEVQVELLPMADHLAIMAALQGFFGAGTATPEPTD